jgi:hypothetical protein
MYKTASADGAGFSTRRGASGRGVGITCVSAGGYKTMRGRTSAVDRQTTHEKRKGSLGVVRVLAAGGAQRGLRSVLE